MARMKKKHGQPQQEPRTGVGTPGDSAVAGGAALGGDTGDVGTPRDLIGGDMGGTYGTTSAPEGSTVVTPGTRRAESRKPQRPKAA